MGRVGTRVHAQVEGRTRFGVTRFCWCGGQRVSVALFLQFRFELGHPRGDRDNFGGDFRRDRDVGGGDFGGGGQDAFCSLFRNFFGTCSRDGRLGKFGFGHFNAYSGCSVFEPGDGLFYFVGDGLGGGDLSGGHLSGGDLSGDLGGDRDNFGRNSCGALNDFGRNFSSGIDNFSGNFCFG